MLEKLTTRVKDKMEKRLNEVEYILRIKQSNGKPQEEPDVFTTIFDRFLKTETQMKEQNQLLKDEFQ